jgi:hypothetical protein
MEVAWFAEFSAPRSFGFNHYVHTLEQSELLYVHALVLCETPVKPSGVSSGRFKAKLQRSLGRKSAVAEIP